MISMMKGSSKYVHQRTLVNTQTHISRLRSFQLQKTDLQNNSRAQTNFGGEHFVESSNVFFRRVSWLNCRPRWFEIRMDALELFLGAILKQRP